MGMHWKFVTDHQFYRYDKLCGGQGKFSNKLVKVVAYQRTDHNEYLIREKEIEERIKAKEAKLNAKANEKANRLKRKEDEARAEADAIRQAEEDALKSEEQLAEEARKTKERKEQMMKKLKTFIQNAMWIKLKAIKAEAEAELEAKREVAEKERVQAVLKRKQTLMAMKQQAYDSDNEEVVRSPGFRT